MDMIEREILLVEDSRTQREALQRLLEDRGYSVCVAANGLEAMHQLPLHKPALIICDVVMPEMDGYELCNNVKHDPRLKDIPVLLLTGLAGAEDVISALHCGADNFIGKPFDQQYFLDRVEDLISARDLSEREPWQIGVKFRFAGATHSVKCDRRQILDVLIATFENAVLQSRLLAESKSECERLAAKVEELSLELLEARSQAEGPGIVEQDSGPGEHVHSGSNTRPDRTETPTSQPNFANRCTVSDPLRWPPDAG